VPCTGAPARCCGRASRSGLWRRPCSRRMRRRAARPRRRGRRARRPPGRHAAPSPPPGAPAAPPAAAARARRRRRRGGAGGGASASATGPGHRIAWRGASAAAAAARFSMASFPLPRSGFAAWMARRAALNGPRTRGLYENCRVLFANNRIVIINCDPN
jgi:hypothetical protein